MIIYVLVKGAPLTKAEFDGNFHDVDDRITSLESGGPEARSIDEITAVGNSLIILYNDSTEDTVPFPVIALHGRGDWAASTAYSVNDTITANGVVYVVQVAHTSALTFDAGATDGEAHDLYGELFNIPELTLPPGGAEGYVLTQIGVGLEKQWANAGVPNDGADGWVLTKVGPDPYDKEWRPPAAKAEEIATTTFEAGLNSANKYYRCTNASGCTITIPSDDEVAWPTDFEFTVRQSNNLSVLIVGGSTSDLDVIVNEPRPGYDTETPYEGATVTIKRVGDNEWDYIGPGTLLVESA